MEKNRNMEVKAPFGPRIAKTDMPKNLIDRINKFIDEVVENKVLNKLYDHGKNLAGQVSQEIFLPDEIINEGLSNFLFEFLDIQSSINEQQGPASKAKISFKLFLDRWLK